MGMNKRWTVILGDRTLGEVRRTTTGVELTQYEPWPENLEGTDWRENEEETEDTDTDEDEEEDESGRVVVTKTVTRTIERIITRQPEAGARRFRLLEAEARAWAGAIFGVLE